MCKYTNSFNSKITFKSQFSLYSVMFRIVKTIENKLHIVHILLLARNICKSLAWIYMTLVLPINCTKSVIAFIYFHELLRLQIYNVYNPHKNSMKM
jgi:hypothetical protein